MVTIWPASARFLETLARGGTRRVRVEVLVDGEISATIDSTSVPDPATGRFVQSVGGSLDVSRQQIRRDGTIDLLDVSGSIARKLDAGQLLVPLRGELRPWVGLQYHDATSAEIAAGTDVEYVPVGTLPIMGIAGTFPAYRVPTQDRMALLPKLSEPYGIAKATNVRTALVALLSTFVPASRLALSIPTTDHVTGALAFEEGTETRDIAHQLATAGGWMLYADPLGRLVAVDEPSTADDPVIEYRPGQLSMLLRPENSIDATDAPNTVIATAEGHDGKALFRSKVTDDDMGSPTYVRQVGERPIRHSSPLWTTQAQTDQAARTLFRRDIGIANNTVVPVFPNPCLEAGDVLYAEDPDQGLAMSLLADQFPVAMRASDGPQRIVCRARVLR